MRRVAVLGASGFVGTAVCAALVRRGADVHPVTAPRLRTSARTVPSLRAEVASHAAAAADLAAGLGPVDVVVNAAGVADAASGDADLLFGANALLPGVLASSLDRVDAGVRLVHVSSAAVQGRSRRLDESPAVAPFSPYSESKALAEQLLSGRERTVMFRPTSVHGSDRTVTQTLARFLASPLASVAGAGDAPTPQVLVDNVADAVAFVALTDQATPFVVLQPAEGLTTAALVREVGGREPRHVPTSVARPLVSAMMLVGRHSGRAAGIGRRLEMLWFGQDQVDGWLVGAGWRPVAGPEVWRTFT